MNKYIVLFLTNSLYSQNANTVNTHNLLQFIFKQYGGLMSLADLLDIHWYLYVILVMENCGG